MNNSKYYKKVLSILTSGTVLFNLQGCSDGIENDKDNSISYSNSLVSSDSDSISNETVRTVESTLKTTLKTLPTNVMETTTIATVMTTSASDTTTMRISTTPIITTTIENDEVQNKIVDDVINNFKSMKDTLKDNIVLNEFKSYAVGYFITGVDFIFFDTAINGVKFDDMKEDAKLQILSIVSEIDDLIMKVYPTYKEDIGGAVGIALTQAGKLIKNGCKNVKDFSKDKLGEENMESIESISDEFVSMTMDSFVEFGDIINDGKQFVKSWYDSLKN